MSRKSHPFATPVAPAARSGPVEGPKSPIERPESPAEGGSDVTRILQRAVDEAVRLLGADGAVIGLLDEQGRLRFAYESGLSESRVQRWRSTLEASGGDARGLIARAITKREVQTTDDYPADESFEHSERGDAMVREIGIRSLVAAPLIVRDRSVGALAIHADRPSAFTERDIALARALADHAAAAIGTARLIERLAASEAALARRVDIQRSLSTTGAALASLHDPGEVLRSTVDVAVRLLGADGALLDLVDPATGRIRWAHDAGLEDEPSRQLLRALELEVGEGMFGRAVAAGQVLVTGDYLADTAFVHAEGSDEFVRRLGIRSMIAAPLIDEVGSIGVIGVYTSRPDAFGDEEIALTRSFASQATIAVRNARFIDELGRSRAEIARRADAERTLRELAARLTTIRAPDDLLQYVVDGALRLLNADRAQLDLMGPDGYMRVAHEAGTIELVPVAEPEMLIEPHVGMNALAIAAQGPVMTGDYLADERFPHLPESDAYVAQMGIRSVAAAPLIVDGEVLGVLKANARRPDAFGPTDGELLLAIAQQAAVALSNARLIDELEVSRRDIVRRADAERALREISARITAIHDPADVLQQVVDEAARLLDADGAILELVDPTDEHLLRWAYDADVSGHFDPRFVRELTLPVGVGLTGRAVAEGRVLIADDDLAGEFPRSVDSDRFFETTGYRSMLAAPIIGDAGPLGALEVYSTRPHAFGERDADLIRGFATQAAIAIANARLIDDLDVSRRELARLAEHERALREISARITALRDPDEVLQLVVEEARRLIGSDGAHLALMVEDRSHLRPVVAAGVDDETRRWILDLVFPLHGGINGLAASLGRPIRSDDYLVDPRIPHEAEDQYTAARLGIRGMAAVPLRAPAGEIVGTLAVSFRTPHEVDDESIGLLQVLGDQAAVAVSNARLDALLRQSEVRYRHLVENSPDLIWSIDEDARFTFLSDTCERLTGWQPEDLLGGHFGGLVHPSSRDVAEVDWVDGLIDGSNEIRGRVNLLHRDGRPIPAEFIAVSRVLGGRFVGANGSVRDMSERDRLERELKESEERFRFLVENSPDIVFSCDAEGNFTYLSDSLERLLGWPPSELVDRHFGTIIDAGSLPTAFERWTEALSNPGEPISSRLDLVHRDGRRIPYDIRAVASAVDGVVTGLHGSSRDASERARLEADLRQSEARFRDLVETSPDGVWQADADGRFTFWSERATAIFGWSAGDVVGRPYLEVVDASSHPEANEAWDRLVRGDDLVRVRLPLRHLDGTIIPAEVSAVAFARDGRFAGAQGTVRDLRERERLEGDLRRQAGELAARDERAHLARELHDSVTQALFSMTLITRSTELLLTKDPVAAGERLATLRDLQRDALAEMRALIFELRPGGLEQDGLVAALRRQATAVQGRIGLPVVVEAELDERLPNEVEDCLYRIGQEALHNVVKHAAAHTVRLVVGRVPDGVRIAVVDDGSGFDAGSVPPGHLGLAGMRARAERIGGRFRVESRPGRGTTIEVVVPVEVAAAPEGSAAG